MTTGNLLVLGATGQLVLSQALAAGHRVTALVRSPEAIDGDTRPVVVMSTFAAARDRLTGSPAPRRRPPAPLMSNPVKDRTAAEDLLRRSGRRYTIAHATRLTNGPAAGVREVPGDMRVSMSDTVSRADVAAWLLRAATEDGSTSRDVVLKG